MGGGKWREGGRRSWEVERATRNRVVELGCRGGNCGPTLKQWVSLGVPLQLRCVAVTALLLALLPRAGTLTGAATAAPLPGADEAGWRIFSRLCNADSG